MHAVELLVTQHRRLEELFSKVMDAKGDERGRLFGEAADYLVVHFTMEERNFYPAVKARRTEDVLLESLEEHLSLKRVLADLLELAPTDERFEPKIHVLKEQAEHHHKEEEEHLFPKVRKLFDDAQLEELGTEMEKTMSELRKGQPRGLVFNQTDAAAPLP